MSRSMPTANAESSGSAVEPRATSGTIRKVPSDRCRPPWRPLSARAECTFFKKSPAPVFGGHLRCVCASAKSALELSSAGNKDAALQVNPACQTCRHVVKNWIIGAQGRRCWRRSASQLAQVREDCICALLAHVCTYRLPANTSAYLIAHLQTCPRVF